MKKPDEMPEHKAQLPRNSHVLSHDFGFTATTGHLLPVFHTIMSPGDTIKLGFDFNLRTMQLEAASFADLVTHVEYFFVPMQLLYQPFDNIYYDIKNNYSSLFNPGYSAFLPLLDMDALMTRLQTDRSLAAMYYPDTTLPVESVGQSAIRLFDMLGFNPIAIAATDGSGGNFYQPNIFPYQLLAYHCIYEYFYRLDTREAFNQQLFNWDRFYISATVAPNQLSGDFWRLHYRPLRNDYFTDVKVSPIVDVLNLNEKSQLAVTNQWLSRSSIPAGNILSSAGEGSNTSADLGYAPAAYRNPSGNIQTQFAFQNHNSLNLVNQGPLNGADISTANIRALFANEKLWSITGRAKKTYDDQTLAHFGYHVPHDVKHEITCFGKDDGKIHIGEVISTANTSLSPLGEIAGKGYGAQSNNRHTFTAPCHGVVMAIFSVECVHNYEAGIAKENCIASKFDFFIPEYDHLGMQPLFGYETMYKESTDTSATDIIGWQYRYEQWKRRYNRTTGAFRNSTGTLKSWIPTFAPYGGNYLYLGQAGKVDNLPNSESYKSFLNLPTDVNQMFLAQYPETWSAAYESVTDWAKIYDNDPFVINGVVDAVLVSTMSDYSLPRLDA